MTQAHTKGIPHVVAEPTDRSFFANTEQQVTVGTVGTTAGVALMTTTEIDSEALDFAIAATRRGEPEGVSLQDLEKEYGL